MIETVPLWAYAVTMCLGAPILATLIITGVNKTADVLAKQEIEDNEDNDHRS